MAKKKAENQSANLIPDHKKWGIALNYMRVGGVPHFWKSFNKEYNVFLDLIWRTPNSLKDSNVSPSERQRKKEESGRAP
jgi:hypothetical protein